MKPRPRLLIVEDERLIAFDLSRRLPKLGYEVCAIVPTGEEAVQKAAELAPSLILMDICLKGAMDGVAAAEIIRAKANVPIIFLTANADEMTLGRAKVTHPSSYVLKPFKERELQISIDLALQNHGLQTELASARDLLEQRVAERTAELAQANASLHGEIEVRKRMEAQAREQADLLAKARDAIYVRDLKGVVSYWNRSAERLYGVAETEALGHRTAELLGEDGTHTVELAEQETLERGEWTGELRQLNRAGQELTVESRWTLVRDEAGAPRTILVVNTDVTERKKTAEKFLRAQRLESVGALASGIAHDLNNVFAPILMAAELMKQETADAESNHLMDMIKLSTQRGTEMVKQVLMFVRGGTNELEPMSLGHLVREVQQLMEQTLPCTIGVKVEVERDLALVLGDPTQLHQVVVNLCVNARDAMPDGGELRLQLEKVAVSPAEARSLGDMTPGTYVRLTVADTGTGMPPEVQAKIFDPFFTTKEIGKGTGLGLATVASIIQTHRGVMKVESKVGRGTRFIIYLPVCEVPDMAAEKASEQIVAGQGELLIVTDDDHSVREITKLTLEAHNYRVLLATNGAEALSVYLQHREETALVITDILMPVMHGRALIHALRQLSPSLPVLAFSAADHSNPLVGTLGEVGVALLCKPATSVQLLTAVAKALKPVASAGAPVPEPDQELVAI